MNAIPPSARPAVSSSARERGRRLRKALTPGSFAYVVELVPWRGPLGDDAGARVRALAAELRGQPAIDAVSITDSAGGHAMLSPEVLASELAAAGQEAIVHVTCRDRNRNELLSLGWRLASAGIGNLLVLSGDYPTEGFLGMARPVFDLDSVSLLALYEASNRGTIGRGVVGRPVPRDRDRDVSALGQAPGYGRVPTATDFYLGAAVNPFKRLERDLVPQYLKLTAKAHAGARFAITQVGYDPRKLDECARYVAEQHLPLRLLANVFVLSRTTARLFAAGEVPGVQISGDLAARAEKEAQSPDKGRAFFLELAARQVAIARGLGYAGAYLGGTSKATQIAAIIERAASFDPDDWRSFVREEAWAVPGTFYLFRGDPATGLNTDERTPLAKPRRAPLAYRFNRLVHRVAFEPGGTGFQAAGRAYGTAERLRLGHLLHVGEQAVKIPMFDCRDCGDCSLPEIAYLCPESQCVKNQRNGPCGGSHDGECEIPGKPCIWARAYERLRPYGEAEAMLNRTVAVPDNSLRRTSAWANTYLGRDHATRARPWDTDVAASTNGSPGDPAA
jgi:methylenetetrahydrofolate reductase (NADPH)